MTHFFITIIKPQQVLLKFLQKETNMTIKFFEYIRFNT